MPTATRLSPEATLEQVLADVREAFLGLASGRIVNPPRSERVGRPGDPDFFRLDMPATLLDPDGEPWMEGRKVIEESGGRDTGGGRALGERRAWIELRHLPSGDTATLDADAVTDLRTGAAAAWAVEALAPGARTVAILGTGRVATTAAQAIDALVRPARLQMTSRRAANRCACAGRLCGRLSAPVAFAGSVDAALAGADAAVAAVPASEPLLTPTRTAGLRAIVAVEGDPRAVLLDPALLARGPVVADDVTQARASGSLRRAGDVTWATTDGRAATLADVLAGRAIKPPDAGGAIVVLTGLAALDVTVAAGVWARSGGPGRAGHGPGCG